jgi:hypothetical protein
MIYICTHKICNPNDKILLVLSFQKNSTAAAWATWLFDEHKAHDNLSRWNDFLYTFKLAFKVKTLCCKAHKKQSSHKIDDFVSWFNTLAIDADIDSLDTECIQLLEKNICSDIIDRLYLMGSVPQTYLVY